MAVDLDSPKSPYKLSPHQFKAGNLSVGGYYIACYDGSLVRVRALEVTDDKVNCFLIDFGDDTWITKDDIYVMKQEYAREQAQAFICRLAGLEDLYEVSEQSETMQQLVGLQVEIELDYDRKYCQ